MQLNIFELSKPRYKIKKPIRLVETFAGIGSQAKSLKKLKADFEHYKICEWEVNAVASYKAIHKPDDKTDYSLKLKATELVEILYKLGISNDGKSPMTLKQIERKNEKWLRQTYNNIKATNNIVNITKIGGKDLEIVDTNKYEYIMTYSFPCQDVSPAGKLKGMAKGDNTRSGLLWEVERLLNECSELPQILLMENVPQVIGAKFINDFNKWQLFLESKGYSNYVQVLNAKDYGIPQNRNRAFMVSILGDYYYEFPRKKKLKLRLKDMLEDEVDEKYYLSDKMIEGMKNTKFESYKLDNKLLKDDGVANTIISRFEGTPQCVIVPEATKKGYAEAQDGDGVYTNRPHQKRGVVQKGMIQTIKAQCDDIGVVVKGNYSPSNHNASRIVGKQVAQTLNTSCNQAVVESVNKFEEDTAYGKYLFQSEKFESKELKEISTTIKASKVDCGVIYNLRIRKLTPREVFRLMGFDDEDFEKAAKVNSNTQLYKQAGNSIVVNVLEEIFKMML